MWNVKNSLLRVSIIVLKLIFPSPPRCFDYILNSWQIKWIIFAVRLARLKADDVFTAPCNSSVLYPTSGGNIHQFTAITPCAVLDVLGPPYSKEDGRDCSYYKEIPFTLKGKFYIVFASIVESRMPLIVTCNVECSWIIETSTGLLILSSNWNIIYNDNAKVLIPIDWGLNFNIIKHL